MSLITCLVVMLGGALGTLARYLISTLTQPISRSLPWGTIGINVAGSFVIGYVGALVLAGGRLQGSDTLRLFVMVGVCGGFTTFSSFSLQTLDLLRDGAVWRAAFNAAASVVLCVGAAALGQLAAGPLDGQAS